MNRRGLVPSATVLASSSSVRVTFGVIVLNGEPFTRYALRALYPFAHEIIVVEGAAPGARNIATGTGHSRDGTLETLRAFKADEDPAGRLTIVTAEDEGHPDGFWPGEKDEQSRAYATRATGDYLWQVDIDEFYRADEMARVLATLSADPGIDTMSFRQVTFWGGLDYVADGWYLRRGAAEYHRLFRWRPGYVYQTHRPPTVVDETGRDLRSKRWLDAAAMVERGVHLYHYSLLLPKQVIEKCDYYATAEWARRTGAVEWANEAYLTLNRPFRVHNVFAHPSWLERYRGPHPAEIVRMMADLRAPGASVALRDTADIERLIDAPWYRLARTALRWADPWDLRARRFGRRLRRLPRRIARAGRRGPGRTGRAARDGTRTSDR